MGNVNISGIYEHSDIVFHLIKIKTLSKIMLVLDYYYKYQKVTSNIKLNYDLYLS